ncbi:MAG TPA: hypothetical protein VI603_11525 [Saprospiraceae bacterium]|nr:hypothetical protein [Saprospiraceae bacterium]
MKEITRLLFLSLFLTLTLSELATAQFGLGGRYSAIQDGYWQEEVFNGNYDDQLASVYAMYWFRLKNKRIEFLPEVGYYHSFSTASIQAGPFDSQSAFYVQFNADVYFFDLGSDCNCPTFSKQGGYLKRGLFAEISPGIEFRKLSVEDLDDNLETVTRDFNKTVPKVYAGLGFDFGISDLLTITPTAGITYLMNAYWDGFDVYFNTGGSSNVLGSDREWRSNIGLRLLFRPDYIRKRR